MKISILFIFVFLAGCGSKVESECYAHAELEFFNTISGTLEVVLSRDAEPMKNLPGNMVSQEGAKLLSVKLLPEIFVEKTESFRPLTEAEFRGVAYNDPHIKLVSLSNEIVAHRALNGRYFTVRELLGAVELTEKKTRGNSEWFGGIDVHHTYFEGVHCESGKRHIYWGS